MRKLWILIFCLNILGLAGCSHQNGIGEQEVGSGSTSGKIKIWSGSLYESGGKITQKVSFSRHLSNDICRIIPLEKSIDVLSVDDVVQNCKQSTLKKYYIPYSHDLSSYDDTYPSEDYFGYGMFLVEDNQGILSIHEYSPFSLIFPEKVRYPQTLDCSHKWNKENASEPGGQFRPPLNLMHSLTTFVNKKKQDIKGKINQLGAGFFASCPYSIFESIQEIRSPYGGYLEKGGHYFLLGARNDNLQYMDCPPVYFIIDGKLYSPGKQKILTKNRLSIIEKSKRFFTDFSRNKAIVKRFSITVDTGVDFGKAFISERNIGEYYIDTCEIPLG